VSAGAEARPATSASACSCPAPRCFGEVRGLFGGARLARGRAGPARRRPSTTTLGEQAVLLALAATAYHAVAVGGSANPSSRQNSSSVTACSAACWRA
jgi:3-hydroxyethyl bacteriochlorophyllide a dehydrogenase